MKEWLDENFKDMDPKEFVSIFNSSDFCSPFL